MHDVRVTLRTATAADGQLLKSLFADRLAAFLAAGLGAREAEQLVDLQYRAQAGQFALAFPDAESSVIEVDGEPAGRLLVDRGPHELRIVDIALLPAFRGHGLGARVLLELLDEAAAAGRRVKLSVHRDSPAQRLYERLGFRETSGDDMYAEMICDAPTGSLAFTETRPRMGVAP